MVAIAANACPPAGRLLVSATIDSMAKLTVQLPPASELPRLRRALFAWHRRHGLRAPWRSSGDPYQVLVAAVMAQQTQMSRVLPKFDAFIAAFPTVEALARNGRLAPIQQGFHEKLGAQCGFCTSGMLMTCKALLAENPNPTREEIGRYLNGNICRCGAYLGILAAIQETAAQNQKR